MVTALQAEREARGRGDRPFAIGHITPFIHVGTPSWDVDAAVISGSPDEIAAAVLDGTADGVNQLQVRFVARSIDEYCDQIEAFGTVVAPLLKEIS